MKIINLQYLKNNGIYVAIIFSLILIVSNSILVYVNQKSLQNINKVKSQAVEIHRAVDNLWKQVLQSDVGIRGYMLVQEEKFIQPMMDANEDYEKAYQKLRTELKKQGFDVSLMKGWEDIFYHKMNEALTMKELIDNNDKEKALEILKEDNGLKLWLAFSPFYEKMNDYEKKVRVEAESNYQLILNTTIFVQILLLILAFPTLIMVCIVIRRNNLNRKRLYTNLENSTRKYIFDPQTEIKNINGKQVILTLIDSLKHASEFISEISKGNYEVDWKGINSENEKNNQENLAGELIHMREQMKKVKDREQKRNWVNIGLAKFSELLRFQEESIEKNLDIILPELVKYVGANQGGFFVLSNQKKEVDELELKACYAYNKKKFINNKVQSGEGLVGQVFLEKEKVVLTDVPEDYISITSGLGEATPECLIILPLLSNEEVIGVLELASFQPFEDYQIEFIEKLTESIASALYSLRINDTTKQLLQETQTQSEMLRSQEEELRQNQEELLASQEELIRKNAELEKKLSELQNN
ncbi:GAF domain-containing protein [Flexithrix dorotheae]|uniref:GAF domain-containing protein n=1 Tax=Flexithrix dorotheae TaxID=70993 RepID=UPI0003749D35|nr:GAF domain-containing protein [Flexithrix dorotheae]